MQAAKVSRFAPEMSRFTVTLQAVTGPVTVGRDTPRRGGVTSPLSRCHAASVTVRCHGHGVVG